MDYREYAGVNPKDVHYNKTDLRSLRFQFDTFTKGRYSYKECRNIIAFDIEASNGFAKPVYQKGNITRFTPATGFSHKTALENADYYQDCIKVSLMYNWQCAIEQENTIEVFMGRTWESFSEFLNELSDCVRIQSEGLLMDYSKTPELFESALQAVQDVKQKPIVHMFIHNLGYEFQHLRNLFEDKFSRSAQAVFARTKRKPMKCKFTAFKRGCIFELNDTLVLTQKSLAQWGKDGKFPVQKLKEPKDFYLPVRTPVTPLSEEMIKYCINDVVTMIYGVRQYRDKYGELHNIPMTQTGQVRRVCEAQITQKNPEWAAWCQLLAQQYSFEEYCDMLEMFVGGSTHASARWAHIINYNLRCFDFASSYPAVMTTRKFPVGKFQPCSYEDCLVLMQQPLNDRTHCFYIKVKLRNVQSKRYNTFWSESKCRNITRDEKYLVDNGKISSCSYMEATMTDLDWDIFNKCYDFDIEEIIACYKAEADYLPKEMILTILGYYGQKTELKDVGRDSEYNESKQFVNSIYGCCVTRVISDEIMFKNGWTKEALTEETYYERRAEATKKAQFVCYQLGVWVTAWARHNLWDGILQFDDKVVYYDTDSLKGYFDDEALQWFADYNENIKKLCEKVAKHYGFDPELYCPKTPKGKPKPLGYFAREDDAVEFKTLGAKRYAYKTEDGEIHVTVAGLPKSAGSKVKSIEDFLDSTTWTTEESGKLGACYNDNQPELDWIDENGEVYHSKDKFGLCLMPVTFEMGVAEDYKMFCDLVSGNVANYDYFSKTRIFRDL